MVRNSLVFLDAFFGFAGVRLLLHLNRRLWRRLRHALGTARADGHRRNQGEEQSCALHELNIWRNFRLASEVRSATRFLVERAVRFGARTDVVMGSYWKSPTQLSESCCRPFDNAPSGAAHGTGGWVREVDVAGWAARIHGRRSYAGAGFQSVGRGVMKCAGSSGLVWSAFAGLPRPEVRVWRQPA